MTWRQSTILNIALWYVKLCSILLCVCECVAKIVLFVGGKMHVFRILTASTTVKSILFAFVVFIISFHAAFKITWWEYKTILNWIEWRIKLEAHLWVSWNKVVILD